MVNYAKNDTSVHFTQLTELRKKSVNEIAEVVKSVGENKKKLNVQLEESHNLKQLQKFAENQVNCIDICKNSLIKKYEKDLIEYTKINETNDCIFSESNRKKLENQYKQLEEQFCYHVCSTKYDYLLSERI